MNNLNLQRTLVGRTVVHLDILANTSKPIVRWILYIDYVDRKDLAGMGSKAQCLQSIGLINLKVLKINKQFLNSLLVKITFDRVALYKCVASCSSRTCTNSHMANNLTYCVSSARVYTWIYAALSYASFIHGTVWTDSAFGSTFKVWVTMIFGLASTNTIIAYCICSTRWRVAGVTSLRCWNYKEKNNVSPSYLKKLT